MNHGSPTRRSALKIIASGAAGYVAASTAVRRASAENSPKIVLGTLPIDPAIASYIGEVDFFKDEGLAVEITRFQNFAPIAQGMAAGSVVAGEMGVAPSIIVLTRGLPLIAPFLSAFSTPDHPFERIMVLPDSPIKTLDDLKGKKLAFLGAGTVPDMLLNGLPKKTKISKQDIKLVPMPAPNMPDALAEGLVDAIFAIPPADTVAERKYHARTIANATELVPYAGLSTFALRRDFADANPETARKLFRACIRFTRWIDDNPLDARKVVAKNLGLPGELAAHMRIPLFARQWAPGDAQCLEPVRDSGASEDDRSSPRPGQTVQRNDRRTYQAVRAPRRGRARPAARPRDRKHAQGRLSVPPEAGDELLRGLGASLTEDVGAGLR